MRVLLHVRHIAHTLTVLAFASGSSAPAQAHIELALPLPKFNDGQNKWCPCGGGGDGSRRNTGCAVSATDSLARGDNVTTFAAGETITVEWRETVNHTGRYRISFDPAGADQADFDANILVELADDSTENTGTARLWRQTVTLPMTPCGDCTLQLVQIMSVDPDVDLRPATPTNSYFQCANIVIAAPAEGEGDVGEGEGEGEGDVGEGEGEGDVGEGEGEGEGEGDVGEGEGDVGEGEGDVGEGEGDVGVGAASSASCAASGLGAPLALLAMLRRRRR